MKHFTAFAMVIISVLLLILLIITLVPHEIDFCFHSTAEKCINNFKAGVHTITVSGNPQNDGDKGPIILDVQVDGESAGQLSTSFNFDTLMHVPPGYTRYRWVDSDIFPDLLIELSSGATWYVSSAEGKLHELNQ